MAVADADEAVVTEKEEKVSGEKRGTRSERDSDSRVRSESQGDRARAHEAKIEAVEAEIRSRSQGGFARVSERKTEAAGKSRIQRKRIKHQPKYITGREFQGRPQTGPETDFPLENENLGPDDEGNGQLSDREVATLNLSQKREDGKMTHTSEEQRPISWTKLLVTIGAFVIPTVTGVYALTLNALSKIEDTQASFVREISLISDSMDAQTDLLQASVESSQKSFVREMSLMSSSFDKRTEAIESSINKRMDDQMIILRSINERVQ